MDLLQLSLAAFLACVVASMVIGFLWYSPVLFATPWMKLRGLSKEEVSKGPSPWTWVCALACGASLPIVLAFARSMTGIQSLTEFAHLALLLWAAFYALPTLNNVMFGRDSKKLWLIEAGYVFVVTAIDVLLLWFL